MNTFYEWLQQKDEGLIHRVGNSIKYGISKARGINPISGRGESLAARVDGLNFARKANSGPILPPDENAPNLIQIEDWETLLEKQIAFWHAFAQQNPEKRKVAMHAIRAWKDYGVYRDMEPEKFPAHQPRMLDQEERNV